MLVGILAVLLGMAGVAVRDSVGPLESASYVLVTAVGLWLFAAQLRRRPQAGHGHNHSHDQDGGRHHPLPDPVILACQARAGTLGKPGALDTAAHTLEPEPERMETQTIHIGICR